MLNLLSIKAYAAIGVVLLAVSSYGVYKYQQFTIDKLETEKAAAVAEVLVLKTNLTGVTTLAKKYNKHQTKDTIERENLQASTSRIDKIIKAKPELVAKRIKSSYSKFHLEKACYSGNQEACDELKKD